MSEGFFGGRVGAAPESATTPAGSTPRQLQSELVQIEPTGKEGIMPAEWVDFKSVKAKVSMETVLSHYDVRLRRVGVDEFRGKCPLPTHSSARSNDSFSVSFTRNA